MSMLELPWAIPVVGGNRYRVDFMPSSSAPLPMIGDADPGSTAAYYNNLTSSEPAPPAAPASTPSVGRPDRGKRSTVKAARRAARRSR